MDVGYLLYNVKLNEIATQTPTAKGRLEIIEFNSI